MKLIIEGLIALKEAGIYSQVSPKSMNTVELCEDLKTTLLQNSHYWLTKDHVIFLLTWLHVTRNACITANMADDSTPKRRGRYKEFLRYSNPYKFSAARRQKSGKNNIRRVGRSRCVFQKSLKKTESEFNVADVCEESSKSSQHESSPERVHTMVSTSLDKFCDFDEMQDMDETFQYEFEETHDGRLSEDELDLTSSTDGNILYDRFVIDDEARSDIFSDCENIESDSEYTSGEFVGEQDEMLYSEAPITSCSSVVLLLSFVFKHKLTREAFSDLLALVEAHCPQPNNCKTTVKKLFEFVSQAKGDVVKHLYCGYCNAYFGRSDAHTDTEVNRTCSICGKGIPKDSRFFIEVPIVKQLRKFFSGKCTVFCYGLTS